MKIQFRIAAGLGAILFYSTMSWSLTIPSLDMEALGLGDVIPVQQYDRCGEGVFSCAEEVRPLADFNDYSRAVEDYFYGYRVFILIDKSLSAGPSASRRIDVRQPQTMYVYERQPDDTLKAVGVFPVSTGKQIRPDKFETREGFMRVQSAQAFYRSRQYREDMPLTLWFESEYGTAIHQTSQKACDEKIGMRASHGCVRLCPNGDARKVFDLVTGYSRSTPIVLLDKRSGLAIAQGRDETLNPWAYSQLLVSEAPKVIRGFPAFVRIIEADTREKEEEIDFILRNPTTGFRRYFPPFSRTVLRSFGI